MSEDTRVGFTPNLVVGIGVTLFGVVLTLDRLGAVNALGLLRFWPVLVILLGASIVWQALHPDPSGRPGQPILSAPLVVFLVVAGVIATRTWGSTGESGSSDGPTVSVHAVLSANRRTVTSTAFERAEVTAIMGESRLDLRQATLAPGQEAVIDVVTLMGSTIVFVPRDWDVNFDAVPVMAGVRDERQARAADAEDDADGDESDREREADAGGDPSAPPEPGAPSATPPRPRLVLRGFVMMGGLAVRS